MIFTGYPIHLERRDILKATSSPYQEVCKLSDLPTEIDPRDWLRTENQGPMGSCRGHSLSTGAEFLFYIATGGQITQFSPMWCYLMAQKRGAGGQLFGSDRGSTIEGGVKVIEQDGICPLDVFPYPNPVRYSTHIPAGAAAAAAPFKAARHLWIEEEPQAHEWLGAAQGYIDIGVRWPFRHNRGLVTDWNPTGNGGHAMAFCGYKADPVHGLVYILFNSHSESSGDKGEFYFTRRAFAGMLRDSYSSVVGITDLTTPMPRTWPYAKKGYMGTKRTSAA